MIVIYNTSSTREEGPFIIASYILAFLTLTCVQTTDYELVFKMQKKKQLSVIFSGLAMRSRKMHPYYEFILN